MAEAARAGRPMALYTLDADAVRTPGEGRFWVAPNAVVIGKVEIGEDASIWFNVVIRGDNELVRIGAGSNVQDGSVLHTDPGFPLIIGPDCTVGHMAMLHGCTIGRGSLIGIGAIVLNGAEIGEESLIGAHALIPEGKAFPPRSLVVGAPGRVVRQLSDGDVEHIREAAAIYRKRWKQYAAGLRPQG
jgi:carbonic anhydrase/acetyltransferase-like protein (isoleucine patch superfamily)